ncbi:hypothetical protein [Crocosphaera sp. XPORK-15E]|uniref:Spy/CpxP family protein refolding chaperone n=1 Tax=Crocosphaera sp. XPORK-15E TaxID=3110247 RepID=UPI002B1EB1FF|nr:hypothetical protein [Crocosphaera sp. XPORK-15E]MEA5537192.1 hypothetical protein [Crocosphaera sp. XPORK-15E]
MKRTLILSSVLLVSLPFYFVPPAFSQSTPNTEQRGERFAEKLNLSESQKNQWQEIQKSSRDRILAILTPEQQKQLENTPQQGRGKNWRSLNFTEEQKSKMRTIRQETSQQMQAILTPEQQQIWGEMKKNRGRNR